MAVVLIGGGSRSGKSTFALETARARGNRLAFVATAEALDEEMRERIAAHQRGRGPEFTTIEEPLDLGRVLDEARFDAIVVDCLTLWLSNLMLAGRDVEAETRALIGAATRQAGHVLLVTNEVGCGIVPDNESARCFRDLAGRMNQDVARAASEVYWMVFGHPLRIK